MKTLFGALLPLVAFGTVLSGQIPPSASADPGSSDVLIANPGEDTDGLFVNRATGGRATACNGTSPSNDAAQAFDGSVATRWRTSLMNNRKSPLRSVGWIRYQFPKNSRWAIVKYRITPCKDSPDSDPMDWQLLGSADGYNWTTLDTRVKEVFTERRIAKTYAFANSVPYAFYCLNIIRNSGNPDVLQVAELELFSPPVIPPPTALSASTGRKEIVLSWMKAPDAVGHAYTVKRATTPGGPYAVIASNLTATTCRDTDVKDGVGYSYVVVAVATSGESLNSNEATAALVFVEAPSNLVALAGLGRVDLSWTRIAGEATYNLKRAADPAGPFALIAANIPDPACTDAALTGGDAFYYVVSASKPGGESDDSAAVKTVVPPDAPADLAVSLQKRKPVVTWTASHGAASYTLQRASAAEGPYVVIAKALAATTFADDTVSDGRSYCYVVSASNAGGEGAVTSPVRIKIPYVFRRN